MAYRRFETLELFSIPEIVKITDNRWHPMDLSPDGRELVFKWPISGAYELYVVALAGGEPRQITHTERVSQCVHPRWSPTGEVIAFLRDQGGDRRFHVWVVDPRSGTERRVTSEPVVSGDSRIEWSRDAKRLAFRSWDDDMKGIWTVDVATGATRRVVDEVRAGGLTGEGVLPDWSHDGRFIAYQTATSTGDREQPLGDVIAITGVDGGGAWTLDTNDGERARVLFPRWSPDDATLFYTTDRRGRYEVAALPVRDGRAAGKPRYLTSREHDEFLLGIGQSGALLYRRQVDGTVLPCRVRPDGTRDETLIDGVGVCFAMREAPDGTLAYVWSSPLAPPELFIRRPGEPARQVTSSLPAGFDTSALVQPRHVRYTAADGNPVPALLWEPHPEARVGDPGKLPPAIVMAHGGGTREHFRSWDPIPQFFANHGYVVLAPNARGSLGYGRAHREGYPEGELGPRNPMTGPAAVDDHVKGADWLEREGIADGARIAITGPSAGAQITIAGLVRAPGRFAAGCASRGGGNMIGELEKLQSPLLILAGKNDPMVPVAEIERLIAALGTRGVAFDAHIYPDEGHGYRDRRNLRDAFERQIAFYDRFVKRREAAPV